MDLSNNVNDLSSSHYNLSGVVLDLSASHYNLSGVVLDLSSSHYNLSGVVLDLSNTVNDLSSSHYNLSGVVLDLSASHYNLSGVVLDLSSSHYNLSGVVLDLSNTVNNLSSSQLWETDSGYTVTKTNNNARILGNLDVCANLNLVGNLDICGNIDLCSNVTIGENSNYGFLNYNGTNTIQFSNSIINLNPSIGTYFGTPLIFGADNNDGNIYWDETGDGLVFKSGDSDESETGFFNFLDVNNNSVFKIDSSNVLVDNKLNLNVDNSKAIIFSGSDTPVTTTNSLYRSGSDLYWNGGLLNNNSALLDLSNTVQDLSSSHYNLSGVVLDLSSSHFNLSGVVLDLSSSHYNLSGVVLDLSNTVNDLSSSQLWETDSGYTVTKTNNNARILGNLDVCANISLAGNLDICANVLIGENTNYGFLNYNGTNTIQFSNSIINLNPSIGTYIGSSLIFGADANDGNIYWDETGDGLIFKSGDADESEKGFFNFLDVNNNSVFKIDSSNVLVDNKLNLNVDNSKAIIFSGSDTPVTTTNSLYRSGSDLYWNGGLLNNNSALLDLSNTVNDLSSSQLWESTGGYTVTKTNNNARILGNLDVCGNIDICSNVIIGENGTFGFLNYGGNNVLQYNSTVANLNPSFGTYIGSKLIFGGTDASSNISFDTTQNGLRIDSSSSNIEFIDTSAISFELRGKDVLDIYEQSNSSSFVNADVAIQQRGTNGSQNDYTVGGLRFFNGSAARTWGMGIFDNTNFGFFDGTSTMVYIRSTLNGGGTNVPLNFTGLHRCVVDNSINEIKSGLLVETTGDIYNIFYDKNDLITKITPNDTEALPVVKITKTRGSKKIFGVISSKEELINKTYDKNGKLIKAQREYNSGGYLSHLFDVDVEDEYEIDYRYNIASVGEGYVRILLRYDNPELIPEDGDLITSSDLIDGYAELQLTNNDTEKDDIIRSKTIGKLTCNWNNENYDLIEENGHKVKVLGCVLYCG